MLVVCKSGNGTSAMGLSRTSALPRLRARRVAGAAVGVGSFSEQCGGVAVPAGRCEQGRGAGVIGEVDEDLGVESEGAKVVQAQFRCGRIAVNGLVVVLNGVESLDVDGERDVVGSGVLAVAAQIAVPAR